uniref:Uncharacterized protein n=1 Tax=Cacopsylla melanoneura TaxID=428564 RepID=A0A8D9A195_9HEMI
MAVVSLEDKDQVDLVVDNQEDKDQADSEAVRPVDKGHQALEVVKLEVKDQVALEAVRQVDKDQVDSEVDKVVGQFSLEEATTLTTVMMEVIQAVITLLFQVSQTLTTQFMPQFPTQRFLALTNNMTDTTQMLKLGVKCSTFVIEESNMISSVPMAPFSINSTLFVYGGISLNVVLHQAFMI